MQKISLHFAQGSGIPVSYTHLDVYKRQKVANVDYPPNGVANFAIMLMLMSLRKAGHILKRGEAQDYSLPVSYTHLTAQ